MVWAIRAPRGKINLHAALCMPMPGWRKTTRFGTVTDLWSATFFMRSNATPTWAILRLELVEGMRSNKCPSSCFVICFSILILLCRRATLGSFWWLFQTIDIRLLYDKFPSGKGGLKDLYDRGPQSAFFLVKFWVSSVCTCSKKKISYNLCKLCRAFSVQLKQQAY